MLLVVRCANIRNEDTPCQVFQALIMKFSGKDEQSFLLREEMA